MHEKADAILRVNKQYMADNFQYVKKRAHLHTSKKGI